MHARIPRRCDENVIDGARPYFLHRRHIAPRERLIIGLVTRFDFLISTAVLADEGVLADEDLAMIVPLDLSAVLPQCGA